MQEKAPAHCRQEEHTLHFRELPLLSSQSIMAWGKTAALPEASRQLPLGRLQEGRGSLIHASFCIEAPARRKSRRKPSMHYLTHRRAHSTSSVGGFLCGWEAGSGVVIFAHMALRGQEQGRQDRRKEDKEEKEGRVALPTGLAWRGGTRGQDQSVPGSRLGIQPQDQSWIQPQSTSPHPLPSPSASST